MFSTLLLLLAGLVFSLADAQPAPHALFLNVNGTLTRFRVSDTSATSPFVIASELNSDVYRLREWADTLAREDPLVIVDVGANVGLFSIVAAHSFPRAHIYAYEPLPANYRNLLSNLRRNNASRVVALNTGIADSPGRRLVTVSPVKNSGGATMVARNAPGRRDLETHEAEVRSLDEVLGALPHDHVSLLKMDCEGCEHAALGASRSLHKVKAMVAEWHMNDALRKEGRSFEALEAVVAQKAPGMRLVHHDVAMS